MFLRNCWYVAAETDEVTRDPLGRTICNERIVFWRTEDGRLVAFEDRCCHRRMPLRKGRLIGDRLRCHYHGLEFDTTGVCVHVPGQSTIPPGAQVKTYPVAEKYNWIWIWMGDPAMADESTIIPFPWRESDDWGDKGTYFHVNADYRLLIDNLLDQSHLAYVHSTTIGTSAIAERANTRTLKTEDSVTVVRWMVGNPPPPTYRLMMGWGPNDLVDRWAINEFRAPGAVRLLVGAAPGAAQGEDFGFTDLEHPVPADGFGFHNLNFITPETETTCHYFWSNAYNLKPFTDERTELQFQQVVEAFRQDWEVLEMQQRNWDDRPIVNTNVDAGWIAARRMIDDLLADEAREVKASAAE